MKILIDIDRALAEGVISAEQRDRLKAVAGNQTSDLALNILIGFGIVAVTIGFIALSGSVTGVLAPGFALAGIGLGMVLRGGQRWRLLGEIMLVVGTALLAGGLVYLDEGSPRAMLLAAAMFTAGAIVAENGLMAGAAVIALSSGLGAATSYEHARYTLIIEEPTETIGVCAILAAGLVAAAASLPVRYERIALIAARTSALMVNFAFLVGSLFGDRFRGGATIPAYAFSVAWAVALVAVAVWAWRENRRWPLVAATVFGALHFYTQFFERIGPNAVAIMLAGLSTIGVGYALKKLLATMPKPA